MAGYPGNQQGGYHAGPQGHYQQGGQQPGAPFGATGGSGNPYGAPPGPPPAGNPYGAGGPPAQQQGYPYPQQPAAQQPPPGNPYGAQGQPPGNPYPPQPGNPYPQQGANPAPAPYQQSQPPPGNPYGAAAAAVGGNQGGPWTCDRCTLRNDASATQCAACGAPRPGGMGASPTPEPQRQQQQQGQNQTFSNCDLKGKTITGATLKKVDVHDCFLSRCMIEEADLYKCTLTNCTTRNVDIKGKVTLNGGTLTQGTIMGGSINNCGGTVSNVDGYHGGGGSPPPQQAGGAYPQQQQQAPPQQQQGGLKQVSCNKCQGLLMVEPHWPQTTCPHCRNIIQLTPSAAPPVAQPVAGFFGGAQTGAQGVGIQPVQAPPRKPPPPLTGRKRALLVGINYRGTRAELHGCVNDVKRMQQMLGRRGWKQSDMLVLHDELHDRSKRPTRRNITQGLNWLTNGIMPGDVLFFHYSGHGAQKPDPHGLEEDGMNETICPEDFQQAGMISDDEIFRIVVQKMPDGSRLTAIMDCCHSGTGLDLPLTWQGRGRGWREETNPFHTLGDVVLFSGCQDDQTSADASDAYSRPAGAMTTAFCDVLEREQAPCYCDLLDRMLDALRRKGFKQRPSMTSSQPFDAQQRLFLLDEICPNLNPTVGRIVRKKFQPRPRQMDRGSGLGSMLLGGGMGFLGGLMLADMMF